jgi:predicted nucleotidyltransferase
MGAMNSAVFQKIVAALNQAGISYMLTGSFASNIYGEGRATQDIDLVVSATPDQLSTLHRLLPASDYYFDLKSAIEAARQKSMFNVLDMASGWKIDFIFVKPGPYHQEAFSRRTSAVVDGVPLIAVTVEDLMIAKLDWARMGESSRQIRDVAGVLKIQQGSIDRPYIEKWVKELGLAAQWDEACRQADLP